MVNDGGKIAAAIQVGEAKIDLEADKAILAVGIIGNVENHGLESTRVRVEKGHIVVDEWLRTGNPHLSRAGPGFVGNHFKAIPERMEELGN